MWNGIPGIKGKKKYIGNKAYWEALLHENNLKL
jgi:hypothetical protein